MPAIKIVRIPPGFAPPEIREQWVGITIPLATNKEIAEDPPSGLGIGDDNVEGYLVLMAKAINALRQAGKEEAAAFWESIPLGTYLQFHRRACEIIS